MITTYLRCLDDNPSPQWEVSECLTLKLLPTSHSTHPSFWFWSRSDDDGGDDNDPDHSDDGDGEDVDDDEVDLPNVAVALKDSAVSLLDIQLVSLQW